MKLKIDLPTAATLALGLAVLACHAQAPDLSKLRPRVEAIPVAEIDRVNQRSGLATCFWGATVSPDTFNILIPDSGVLYWVTQFRLPAGASLALHGQYPKARHISLNSYDASGQPVDRLNDQMLPPDTGSTNPFLPGARRDGTKRDYSVRLVERPVQAGQRVDDATREAGTLVVPQGTALHQLWYRVYVPDQGQDVRGGVALPQAVLTFADGRTLKGEALCKEIVVTQGMLNDVRLPAEALKPLLALKGEGVRSPYHPAQNPPVWSAFFNSPLSVLNTLIGTPNESIRQRMDTTRRGGFYSTLDNTYMSSYIDKRHGEVLVLRAKAPTTPRTQQGAAVMQPAQLRYWSLCKNRSLSDTAVDGCLYDEQVPLDALGRYTMVVSAPASRPANARAECGVAWLDWGAVGDGVGNSDGGFLVYRHMMPAADFKQSIFATVKLGEEREVLGEYYPDSRYMSRAEFEQGGCKR